MQDTKFRLMRTILSVAALFFLVVSCASEVENQMVVTGNIDGLKKGTLLLQKVEDTVLVTVDSLVVAGDATFEFIQPVESPEMYYLSLALSDGSMNEERIGFFGEAKPIQINSSLKQFGIDATVTGSENEDLLKEYRKLMSRYTNRNLELIEAAVKAQQEGNDSLSQAFQLEQNKVLSRKYLATVNFAVKYNDYEISPYLMLTEIYDVNKKYLDTVYTSLTPKIKDSKYGKALESFIAKIEE